MDSDNNKPDETELRLRVAEVQAERAKMVMDSLAGFWLHTWSLPRVEVGDNGSSSAFGSLTRDHHAA